MKPTSHESENILIIGVTWSHHRRMTEICDFLGIQLFEIIFPKRGIYRYVFSAWKTWRLLLALRPKVVFIQSPSLVLALYINLVKHFFSFKVVMDAHNESVQPYINKSKILSNLTDRALASSDLVIVSNPFLAEFAKKISTNVFILPDPMPKYSTVSVKRIQSKFTVAVICTCAPDEPIREILAAAGTLTDEFEFQISGEKQLFFKKFGENLPPNVSLTGFLPTDEYLEWLACSNVVLDLTEMPDCLVCGAYEAIAVRTPMILSDNLANRSLFGSCALITVNRAKNIAAAVRSAKDNNQLLVKKTNAFAKTYGPQWIETAKELKDIILTLGASL